MSLRFWKILPAVAVLMLPFGALGQNVQELSAMVNGPWHHVPDARSNLEFNREIAKCRVISAQTPVDSTTPAVVEIVRSRVLINCLKASGYEPGAQSANSTATSKKRSDHYVQIAGFGPGAQKCSAYISNLGKDEDNYLSWAAGFMTAWNIQSKVEDTVELSALSLAQQIQFLRNYCEANPSKRYLEGVMALMVKLKTAKKN